MTPSTFLTTTDRLQRSLAVLAAGGVDLLVVTPSADMLYLIGYSARPSERPTLLVAGRDRPPIVIIPELETGGVEDVSGLQLRVYAETEDPFALLADVVEGCRAHIKISVSDQMWAAVLLRLQSAFSEAEFIPASPLLRQLRMRKSADEVDLLSQAGAKADAAFQQIVQLHFAGRTERQLGFEIADILRAQGLDTAEWGPIVASGPNSASPHHMTGERVVHEGDVVVLDFGGSVQGYQADITRTVHVGTPDREFHHVYDVVRQAQEAGVRAAELGVSAESVDRAARGVINTAGYGTFFMHRTGHGIGLEAHEEPFIIAGNALHLEPGMTFSVEPGIYLPGRFGVRIEDIVALTESGPRRLNTASRDLIIVH